MCLAIPAKIVQLIPEEDSRALVEVAGVRRHIDIALLAEDPPRLGDWVLVHVGFAMTKISEEQALDQIRMLRVLGEDEDAMREVENYGAVEGGT